MKKIIYTEKAPAPIGPYSQGIMIGDMLFSSGQIAINPDDNSLITSNIEDETKMVMENVKAVLDAADMNFTDVVKATIFITDMNDFVRINTIYGSYFPEDYAPARETVQVAALPKNVNVEISVIASK